MKNHHLFQQAGMTYCLGFPGPPLDQWVDHFLLISGCPSFTQKRVFPNNQVDIFFNLGDLNHGQLDQQSEGFAFRDIILSGLRSSFMQVLPTGYFDIVGLRFRLFGFSDLFGVPAVEISNANVALTDVLGHDSLGLRERLHATPDPLLRLALLEGWLLDRVAKRGTTSDIRLWNRIEQRIRQRKISSGDGLAALFGYSYKHTLQLFTQRAGLHPKTIGRIYRFNCLLAALRESPGESQAALAYHCGYSDQSHMIREFRQFTGFTPLQFLQQQEVYNYEFMRKSG